VLVGHPTGPSEANSRWVPSGTQALKVATAPVTIVGTNWLCFLVLQSLLIAQRS